MNIYIPQSIFGVLLEEIKNSNNNNKNTLVQLYLLAIDQFLLQCN